METCRVSVSPRCSDDGPFQFMKPIPPMKPRLHHPRPARFAMIPPSSHMMDSSRRNGQPRSSLSSNQSRGDAARFVMDSSRRDGQPRTSLPSNQASLLDYLQLSYLIFVQQFSCVIYHFWFVYYFIRLLGAHSCSSAQVLLKTYYQSLFLLLSCL